MEKRRIGAAGPIVSALGLGCMSMAGAYGTSSDRESVATIHRAIELGVTMFDTADVYGPFTNEELLGRALSGRRDDVIVASKFGGAELDDSGNAVAGPTGRPEYVRVSVERSLRRLKTDRIDLYYQHRIDPDVPVEETFGALGELVTAGKLRYLGISEASANSIRRAHATAPLSAVETEYSVFSRNVEANGVLETVRELGIGFVASSPLGRGMLAGAVRSLNDLAETDLRRMFPRFQEGHLDHNLRLLQRVEALAATLQITAGQLSLAWVLAQGADITAIPGTRRQAHLEQNVAGAAVHLDPATLLTLNQAVPAGAVAGDRRAALDVGIEE